jgi:hypothetical protein
MSDTRTRSFETTDGQLACSLSNNKNYTQVCTRHSLDRRELMHHFLQVTLQKTDGNDSSQGWIFCPM